MTEYEEHPCSVCGEPTFNDNRCRECELEYLFETWAECPECHAKQFSQWVVDHCGPQVNHEDTCSLWPKDIPKGCKCHVYAYCPIHNTGSEYK